MEFKIDNYLENVLKSGEEKETGANWYYGKLKDKNAYCFLIHVVVDGVNLGGIIPTAENFASDADFEDVLEFVISKFKRSYQLTINEG